MLSMRRMLVDAGNGYAVMPRNRAQDVRTVVNELKNSQRKKYL